MNLRKPRVAAAVALLAGASALLAGCGGNPLIGKWTGPISMFGRTADATYEFKADGTETQSYSAMGMTLSMNGTYKTDKDSLTQTLSNPTVGGKPMNIPGLGKEQTATYKVDGDTLTLTVAGAPKPVILKRQAAQ